MKWALHSGFSTGVQTKCQQVSGSQSRCCSHFTRTQMAVCAAVGMQNEEPSWVGRHFDVIRFGHLSMQLPDQLQSFDILAISA
jgi:hypothetical protein